jgi:hypothetical protein
MEHWSRLSLSGAVLARNSKSPRRQPAQRIEGLVQAPENRSLFRLADLVTNDPAYGGSAHCPDGTAFGEDGATDCAGPCADDRIPVLRRHAGTTA